MIFSSSDMSQPRVWLREIVRPILDDFIKNPLDMRRAYASIIITYQYHERLYYGLTQSNPEIINRGLAVFRLDLASDIPIFEGLAAAADPAAGHTLKFTNVLSAAFLLAFLTGTHTVQRSIIVTRVNRQLIPLLEELILGYERQLDKWKL